MSQAYASSAFVSTPDHFRYTFPSPTQNYGCRTFPAPSYYQPIQQFASSIPPKAWVQTTTEQSPTDTTSISPDPLPPHSNPQALTQTQSRAFTGANPIPPIQITKNEIRNTATGQSTYTITREAAHMPSFLSTKPILIVRRTFNGIPMGSIRFHSLTTSDIEMTVNGHEATISHSGILHKRWAFTPTTSPNSSDRWYWKKDKTTSGAVLEDAKKHAHALARMKGDLLTFSRADLSPESYDEIILSAIAMAEGARRAGKDGELGDLGSAIGDFTSLGGSGGGEFGGM